MNVQEWKEQIAGKKVAVFGIGISNKPLVPFLIKCGADVTVFDQTMPTDPSLAKYMTMLDEQNLHVTWSLGPNYEKPLFSEKFDYVFRSPKTKKENPAFVAQKEKGAILTSEMETFLEICPAKVFGITGSSGKTTTSTLVSLFLQEAGYRTYLGGNIGTPLLDKVDEMTEHDMVVVELSSFQLRGAEKSCDISVMTNIMMNHLDFHVTLDDYIEAKKNIYAYQDNMGVLVLNGNNHYTIEMKDDAKGKVRYFTWNKDDVLEDTRKNIDAHCFVEDKIIRCKHANGEIDDFIAIDDIALIGRHNVMNMMTAILATLDYVTPSQVQKVAKSFGGVKHRIQFIRTVNNVTYINSSIDTSPDRAITTLEALKESEMNGVIIIGGQTKKCEYDGLGKAIAACCHDAILVRINDKSTIIDPVINILNNEVPGQVTTHEVNSFERAISLASTLAKPGEMVVMSPVGTSYDAFKIFEDRGDLFINLVKNLPETI